MENQLLTNNMFFYVWIPLWFIGYIMMYILLSRMWYENNVNGLSDDSRNQAAFWALSSWFGIFIMVIMIIIVFIFIGLEKVFQFCIVPFLKRLEPKLKNAKN